MNYMAHKEVYGLLRQILLTEAPDQFVFLNIACGMATASAEALKGTEYRTLYWHRHTHSHRSTWRGRSSPTSAVQSTSAVRIS